MPSTELDTEAEDATEEQFSKAFKVALLGVPAMLVVTIVMMAIASGGDSAYFGAALWAALVGGPFFAGVAYLNIVYAREHSHATATPPARRPAATVGRPRPA
ncbi:MAG TPA: hypothetical protein VFJ85_07640 [Acidimicrobiales bacterium]|nr:hypothetical protein [Acidimicrobiales bacterium]